MEIVPRILGLSLALTVGGCGLLYRYGDYKDAPDGGTGGSSTSTTSTTTNSGGAGGCVPPNDVVGDCRKPICAGGVPGTEPDDTDVPLVAEECRIPECSGGSPLSSKAMDGIACDGGLCLTGNCVECLDRADCGGRCCLAGNVCSTAAAGCPNGCLDGDETDVDCGGSCSLKCADTSACNQHSDCKSGYCDPTSHCAPCTDGGLECGSGCCHMGICGACP